jgi:glycosyltransferase involved in cell wall biosynthesis
MVPLPRLALYEAWHYLRRPSVQRATGDVDVVHATGMAIPPKTAPLVATLHDLAFLHEPSHFTKHGLRFFHRSVKLMRRDADVVVVPSQATLEDCVAHGFDPARLRLVPLGVHQHRVGSDDVEAVRRRHGLDRPYLLWVGTVEPRKNLPTLLRAFAAADPADLDLVLVGQQGWNEDLDRLVAPVAGRVKVVGFVDGDDLHALYAGARLFCLPSLREGFGFPVLEAMTQGTPVITSRGTSTAEVAGDAAVLVEPTDVDGLAEAIRALAGDPVRSAELGELGRRRASTFTWEHNAELLFRAYREVA